MTCTIKPSGNIAALKHIARKGVFTVKARNSGQPLIFRPGVDGGNLEFYMLRNPEDQYSFCLYLETQDPSCRLCVMPDSSTSDSGLMVLHLSRADDRDCFVFGSAITVKFTKWYLRLVASPHGCTYYILSTKMYGRLCIDIVFLTHTHTQKFCHFCLVFLCNQGVVHFGWGLIFASGFSFMHKVCTLMPIFWSSVFGQMYPAKFCTHGIIAFCLIDWWIGWCSDRMV